MNAKLSMGVLVAMFGCVSLYAQNPGESNPRAQPGGQPQVESSQPWGGGFFAPGMAALGSDQARKELELVPEQQEKLKAIAKEHQKKIADLYAGVRDPKMSQADRATKFKEIQEQTAKLNADVGKQVKEVLLPQQQKVLEQIELRQAASMYLNYPQFLDKLKVGDDVKEKLKTKREALAEAVAKLQREAYDEMLNLLSAEQKEQLKTPATGQVILGR